jgi:hypothetical protein
MKSICAVLLFCLAICIPAFAEDNSAVDPSTELNVLPQSGSPTVPGTHESHTYGAYRDYPKFEIFGGYDAFSHLRMPTNDLPAANVSGWDTSILYNFTRAFGLKADFSGLYGNEESASYYSIYCGYDFSCTTSSAEHLLNSFYSAMLGPQMTIRRRSINVFGHVLFGWQNARSSGPESQTGITTNMATCYPCQYQYLYQYQYALRYSQNFIVAALGGGMDWHSGRWAIRVFQIDDFLQITTSSVDGPGGKGFNSIRIMSGVVLRFD